MADLKCKIINRQAQVDKNADPTWPWGINLTAYDGLYAPVGWAVPYSRIEYPREPMGTDWIIRDIPMSEAKILLKASGTGDGWALTWRGFGHPLTLNPYGDGNIEQVAIFDQLDGGWVAINNHDRSHVLDWTRGEPRLDQPARVMAWTWDKGTQPNQQWLIQPQ